MVFHTCSGIVTVKSLVDRHIPGRRPDAVNSGHHGITGMAMPDRKRLWHQLSGVWFDDGDDPPGHRSMGCGGQAACICTAFFGNFSRDAGRIRIADRLPEKSFCLYNGNRAQNGINRNRHVEHGALLVAADFHIIKNTY